MRLAQRESRLSTRSATMKCIQCSSTAPDQPSFTATDPINTCTVVSTSTHCAGHPVISSRSLTANSSLYSAIANDYGFEHVFDTQLDFFARSGDVLIAISSSRNSPNVINAVNRAKELGMFVAGFTGFSGGKLAEMADASVHVADQHPSLSCGPSETCPPPRKRRL
jgi:hypothetical protein